MAPKIGLQVPLDLGLESLISIPKPQPQPVQVQEETQPTPNVNIQTEAIAAADKHRKPRKTKADKATPRTVYLTDSVFQRLQLMAIIQKKRISAIIGDLLEKSAENLTIKKVS